MWHKDMQDRPNKMAALTDFTIVRRNHAAEREAAAKTQAKEAEEQEFKQLINEAFKAHLAEAAQQADKRYWEESRMLSGGLFHGVYRGPTEEELEKHRHVAAGSVLAEHTSGSVEFVPSQFYGVAVPPRVESKPSPLYGGEGSKYSIGPAVIELQVKAGEAAVWGAADLSRCLEPAKAVDVLKAVNALKVGDVVKVRAGEAEILAVSTEPKCKPAWLTNCGPSMVFDSFGPGSF